MSDQERRRENRIPCSDSWIEITRSPDLVDPDNAEHRLKVKVENQSSGGLCVISSTPFDLHEKILIHAPEGGITGTVAWTCQSRLECKAGIQYDQE